MSRRTGFIRLALLNAALPPPYAPTRLVGVATRADAVAALYEQQKQAERVSAAYTSPFLISISTLEHLARESRQITEQLTHLRVRDVMTVEPQTIAASADLRDAARLMAARGFHRLPVTEEGRLVGIISSLDICGALARGELPS